MPSIRIDLLAFFVAVIALLFSIWQGWSQIRHNHISVEPRINSYFSIDSKDDKWGIYLINNGMGAGYVVDLDVLVDGIVVPDHEWGKFFSAVVELQLNPMCFRVGGPRKNDSFKVGDEQFLIGRTKDSKLTPKSCPADRILLMQYQKSRLDYRLKFESIYGDTFQYQYSSNEQVEI